MAEQKPLPKELDRAPLPPRPAQPRPRRDLPKPGDQVWYRLSSNMELVPAEVIAGMPTGNPLQPTLPLEEPDEGNLHLKITLNPRKHFSSGSVGYRRNAAEAPEGERAANTWQREKPEDEDEWLARRDYRAQLEQEIRRNIALGRGAV